MSKPKATPLSAAAASHLQLVTPTFDPSRLISSTEPDPSHSLSPLLLPSSDLITLLSDPDLHTRFREGRYKSGTNHNLHITNLGSCLSATLGTISENCPSHPYKVSVNTLINLTTYIGVTAISSWPQVEALTAAISLLRRRTPKISGDLVTNLIRLTESFPPEVPAGREKWATISDCTDEILAGLGEKIGVSAGMLSAVGIAVVLAEQDKRYSTRDYRNEIRKCVSRFRQWMGWKAMVISLTLDMAEEENEE